MKTERILFNGYTIEYYIQSGANSATYNQLYESLNEMNLESGNNLKYGIFKENITKEEIKDFFCKTIVAIIFNKKGEKCGFFYNYIVSEKPLFIHQGLVMIYKNEGHDLLTVPYMYSNKLMYEYFDKDFYLSNISTVPKIVGIFTEMFDNVWPSHTSKNVELAPKGYRNLGNKLYNEYILTFFPEGVFFNDKRFVINSPLKEIGFGTNIRKLPRHKDLMVNLFLFFWIDLSKGEDLVQIGEMTKKTYEKFNVFINKANVKKLK